MYIYINFYIKSIIPLVGKKQIVQLANSTN